MFDSCIELKYSNDDEWHKIRSNKIGGSDSAVILNKEHEYKNINQLWNEKTGRKKEKDISQKEAVIKGTRSEKPLLDILRIRHQDWEIIEPNVTYQSKDYPFMIANLDGIAKTPEGLIGIEIKTTTIRKPKQWDEWKDDVPFNYYCQVLHYMTVTGLKEFVLFAMIDKPNYYNHTTTTYLREYTILLKESEKNLLIKKEKEFYNYILKNEEPPYKKNLTI